MNGLKDKALGAVFALLVMALGSSLKVWADTRTHTVQIQTMEKRQDKMEDAVGKIAEATAAINNMTHILEERTRYMRDTDRRTR